MNVLLVDNLVMPENGSLAFLDVHPNLGLLSIAAVAEAGGHTVRIYDPKRLLKTGTLRYDSTLYDQAASDILSRRPDAVGFTTLGCSFLFAVNVAAILKLREPELPILLGGPHATMLDRQILDRFEQFDVVVRHEADETFPLMLKELETRTFERIPGISWRACSGPFGLRFTDGKPKVENLDSLPLLSYDHYPIAELDLDLMRIEAGRGCPFMCTFCSTASFFQRSFRLKSATRLVQELDTLHARYGFSHFKLDHDMFTVNRGKVAEFCEAVKDRGYRWRASARVDCVDADLLAKMAEAGCIGLYFGIETGSARMQEVCKKRLDLNLVLPTLDIAERLGIEPTASFITGYPEELQQDQNDTLDLLGRCFRGSCLPQLHMLAPEPGTPMFSQLGASIRYDGYGGRYNALLVEAHDEDLILSHPDIFQTYYYYPAALPRARYIFAVEAVDLIRQVGAEILSYILRIWKGNLSALIADFQQFCESCHDSERPDYEILERFFVAIFGSSHHLLSLFRYASLTCRVNSEHPQPEFNSLPDPTAHYVLQSQVEIVPEMHDCALLLQKIALEPGRAELLGESEVGERSSYLLKRAAGGSTWYRIEPGVNAIIELFTEPRTCAEVTSIVREATGMPELTISLLEELVREKIVVSTRESPAHISQPADHATYVSLAF